MTKEIALHRDQGQSIWMVGGLMTFKATAAETDGEVTLVEAQNAPGGGTPPHVHHNEDEFFYVINGEVEVTIGDQKVQGKPGSFVFAPRDIPHSFTITGSQDSRILIGLIPAGLEKCFVELGEPAASLTIPPAAPPDLEKLLSVARSTTSTSSSRRRPDGLIPRRRGGPVVRPCIASSSPSTSPSPSPLRTPIRAGKCHFRL